MSQPTPDYTYSLKLHQESTMRRINCVQIGKIKSVSDQQTCEIELQLKRVVPDVTSSKGVKEDFLTVLVDCPYFTLAGGTSYIDMPIKPGDYCLTLFNDTNIDLWWTQEQVGIPANSRSHSLSDGIALVGISPKTKARTMDGDKVRIIGKGGAESSTLSAAARVGDEVKMTSQEDSTMVKWMSVVTTALKSLMTTPAAPGKPPLVELTGLISPLSAPSDITSKITKGSEEVEIS